jgi:hypothetical protein
VIDDGNEVIKIIKVLHRGSLGAMPTIRALPVRGRSGR